MHAPDLVAQLPMVEAMARSLAARLPPPADLDELVSAGRLGLVEAAGRYDPHRGVSFADFARPRVRGAMLDTLRALAPSSRGARRLRREVDETARSLGHRLGRTPEAEEVAGALGIDLGTLHGRVAAAQSLRTVSLDDLGMDEGTGSRVARALASPDAGADDRLLAEEVRGQVAAALEGLAERPRLVLSLYYLEELRLREIGELLGVTESRVCRIHTAALRALRDRLAGDAAEEAGRTAA